MSVVLFALAAAQGFAAGTPAFDPRLHKKEIAGRPAEVVVLGSPHLSQLPEKLDPKLLEPLLDRLAAFKPDVITVEGLSGEECDTLLRFKSQHSGAWDDYCWPTDDFEKATGLTVPKAGEEIERTLASWPAAPTPSQRRRLAMLFLAAGDRASAATQWLRLPEAERHSGDGLNDAMVETIMRKGKPPNENYAIGSALAARLGLERVYLVDDHIADGPQTEPGYGEALQRVWTPKVKPAVLSQFLKRQANLRSSSDLIALYRFLNDPRTQRAGIAADMGSAARQSTPQLYGRQYVSWWEERNLRMVANIRHAFGQKPNARVLAIVGSTHKGYFDAYLNMMQDVRLIDAMQFLK
jgi:hypothetical protein